MFAEFSRSRSNFLEEVSLAPGLFMEGLARSGLVFPLQSIVSRAYENWMSRFREMNRIDRCLEESRVAEVLPRDIAQVDNAKALFSIIDLQQISVEIVHIGQCHWTKGAERNLRSQQKIWASQKVIAEYLLSNPHAMFFAEGESKTSKYPKGRDIRLLVPISMAFPKYYIPPDLNSFNSEQKLVLMKYGAALVLHYLGKIQTLHRSISPEESEVLDSAIESELASGNRDMSSNTLMPLFYDRREEALLKEIRDCLSNEQHKSEKIVIVYGADHSFERHFNRKNFTYLDTTVSYDLLENLNRSLQESPNDSDARLERASIAARAHRFDDALVDLEWILSNDFQNVGACIYAKQKIKRIQHIH